MIRHDQSNLLPNPDGLNMTDLNDTAPHEVVSQLVV